MNLYSILDCVGDLTLIFMVLHLHLKLLNLGKYCGKLEGEINWLRLTKKDNYE